MGEYDRINPNVATIGPLDTASLSAQSELDWASLYDTKRLDNTFDLVDEVWAAGKGVVKHLMDGDTSAAINDAHRAGFLLTHGASASTQAILEARAAAKPKTPGDVVAHRLDQFSSSGVGSAAYTAVLLGGGSEEAARLALDRGTGLSDLFPVLVAAKFYAGDKSAARQGRFREGWDLGSKADSTLNPSNAAMLSKEGRPEKHPAPGIRIAEVPLFDPNASEVWDRPGTPAKSAGGGTNVLQMNLPGPVSRMAAIREEGSRDVPPNSGLRLTEAESGLRDRVRYLTTHARDFHEHLELALLEDPEWKNLASHDLALKLVERLGASYDFNTPNYRRDSWVTQKAYEQLKDTSIFRPPAMSADLTALVERIGKTWSKNNFQSMPADAAAKLAGEAWEAFKFVRENLRAQKHLPMFSEYGAAYEAEQSGLQRVVEDIPAELLRPLAKPAIDEAIGDLSDASGLPRDQLVGVLKDRLLNKKLFPGGDKRIGTLELKTYDADAVLDGTALARPPVIAPIGTVSIAQAQHWMAAALNQVATLDSQAHKFSLLGMNTMSSTRSDQREELWKNLESALEANPEAMRSLELGRVHPQAGTLVKLMEQHGEKIEAYLRKRRLDELPALVQAAEEGKRALEVQLSMLDNYRSFEYVQQSAKTNMESLESFATTALWSVYQRAKEDLLTGPDNIQLARAMVRSFPAHWDHARRFVTLKTDVLTAQNKLEEHLAAKGSDTTAKPAKGPRNSKTTESDPVGQKLEAALTTAQQRLSRLDRDYFDRW